MAISDKWEYCECGCHGHELRIGNYYYWLYNDLKGNFYLREGHGFPATINLGIFKSFEEADQKVKELIKEQIKELKKFERGIRK